MIMRATHPFLSIHQVANVIAARNSYAPDTVLALGMDCDHRMPLLYSLGRY